jgi:hypothetical protein
VELFRVGLVWVTPRNNAGPARAAGRDRNEGIVKTHAPVGETLKVRCENGIVAVGGGIVPVQIVCDDENEVGERGELRLLREFFLGGLCFFFVIVLRRKWRGKRAEGENYEKRLARLRTGSLRSR